MDLSNINTKRVRGSTVGNRSTEIHGLRMLKTPEEGGSRRAYEEFLETIKNHIAVTWDGGGELKKMITNSEEPVIEEPEELSDSDSQSKLRTALWNIQVEKYAMKVDLLKENKGSLFSLMVNNVSKITKGKLKSKTEFKTKEDQGDVIWLMESLDDIIVKFEKVKPNTLSLDDQLERIMTMRQNDSTSNEDFIKMIKKEVDIFEKHGGTFLWTENEEKKLTRQLEDEVKRKVDAGEQVNETEKENEKKRLKKIIKDEIFAMITLKRVCQRRFRELITHCKNEYLLGKNIYPTSTPDLLKVLNNYESDHTMTPLKNGRRNKGPNHNGVTFIQASGSNLEVQYLRGTNRSFIPTIVCRRCLVKGHYQSQCPVATNDRGSMIPIQLEEEANSEKITNNENDRNDISPEMEVSYQNGFGMSQKRLDAYINPFWILLDSESSEHIFSNWRLLEDVGTTTNGENLRLFSNGGYIETSKKGRFGNFDVWYSPKSIANILSLALVTEEYRVTLDTAVDNSFIMHVTEHHKIKFRRHRSGLYYFDASKVNVSKLKAAFNFLNTVSSNKSMYGKRDIKKANDVRKLNWKINHVAKDKFERIIKNNWIRNLPFTIEDVRRAHTIYGPSIPSLKGRTRCRKASRIPDAEGVIPLPKQMFEDLKNVTLCIDYYFVNGITVFHTISRKIGYRTVSFPNSRTTGSIVKELGDVCKLYNARGFRVVEVHGDKEFEKIEKEILPIRLRTVGTDEHVPEIERSIQTQKNEHRSVCHAMPYKCIPRMMVKELIYQGNVFLNAFGNKESEVKGLSPRNIIDNLPHVDYHDLKYEFGQYVHLHATENFTNTMKRRTIGAIVLSPRKIQGTYNFMSLETGNKISGRVVSELPISDEVIKRVEELGRKQDQPYRASQMLIYEWKTGVIMNDDDEEPIITSTTSSDNMIIPPPINQDTHNHSDDIYQPDYDPVANVTEEDYENNIERDNFMSRNQGAQDRSQGAQDVNGENTGESGENTVEEEQDEHNTTDNSPREQEGDVVTINEDGDGDTILSINNNDVDGEHNNDERGDTSDDDSADEDSGDSDDSDLEERRRIEKERRGGYFKVNTGDNYGKGKRVKKQIQSYSFLQSKFEHLTDEEKKNI